MFHQAGGLLSKGLIHTQPDDILFTNIPSLCDRRGRTSILAFFEPFTCEVIPQIRHQPIHDFAMIRNTELQLIAAPEPQSVTSEEGNAPSCGTYCSWW